MALLDIKAAAEHLSTTERHVRELVYRRDLPSIKVGRLVRIDSDDLAAWIDRNKRPARNGGDDAATSRTPPPRRGGDGAQ